MILLVLEIGVKLDFKPSLRSLAINMIVHSAHERLAISNQQVRTVRLHKSRLKDKKNTVQWGSVITPPISQKWWCTLYRSPTRTKYGISSVSVCQRLTIIFAVVVLYPNTYNTGRFVTRYACVAMICFFISMFFTLLNDIYSTGHH